MHEFARWGIAVIAAAAAAAAVVHDACNLSHCATYATPFLLVVTLKLPSSKGLCLVLLVALTRQLLPNKVSDGRTVLLGVPYT